MSVRDDQLDTLKVGGKDYDFYRCLLYTSRCV